MGAVARGARGWPVTHRTQGLSSSRASNGASSRAKQQSQAAEQEGPCVRWATAYMEVGDGDGEERDGGDEREAREDGGRAQLLQHESSQVKSSVTTASTPHRRAQPNADIQT